MIPLVLMVSLRMLFYAPPAGDGVPAVADISSTNGDHAASLYVPAAVAVVPALA